MFRLPRALPSNRRPGHEPLYIALAGFLIWTFATWLLEGRPQTLFRPEAVSDRLLYTGIANIAIGQIVALVLLGLLFRRAGAEPALARFRPLNYRSFTLIAAILLGLGYHAAAGEGLGNEVVLINAFAQVFVVSAAEVIVCWGLVGIATESSLCPRLGKWSSIGAAIAASVAFGAYHFAHSPPFNTPTMVAFLTVVGLGTSLFFFLTRDLLATIVFHNFPAVAGVTRALAERSELDTLTYLQPPLLATAALSLLVVLAGERLALGNRR